MYHKKAFIGLIVFFLLSYSVTSQEIRKDGNVMINIETAPYLKIVKQTGFEENLKYDFSKVDEKNYDITVCYKEKDAVIVDEKTTNYPIATTAESKEIIKTFDLSKECNTVKIDFEKNPSVKFGEQSTIIVLVEDHATFLITPEYNKCDYLHCSSELIIRNEGEENLTLNLDLLDVSISGKYEIWYWKTIKDGNRSITLRAHPSGELTIQPNEEITFYVESDLPAINTQYKYDVSIFYAGQNFTIDPFFDTTNTTFLTGYFTNTLLNASGFIQLNNSFIGNYSQIIDAGLPVVWKNISLNMSPFQEMPSGNINEKYPHGLNMSDCFLLLHLDENSGSPLDSCIHNLNATATGITYSSDGQIKTGYNFGVGDRINYSKNVANFDRTNKFSGGGWIYKTANAEMNIMSKMDSTFKGIQFYTSTLGSGYDLTTYLVNVYPSNFIRARSTLPIYTNKWYHVVTTYDGSSLSSGIKIYVNGELSTSTFYSGTLTSSIANNGSLIFGAIMSGGTPFQGNMDEMFIFNRTLTATEVKNIYRRGLINQKYQYRVCDDAACAGESYSQSFNTTTSLFSTTPYRYFQYNFDFFTENKTYSPELWKVEIGYDLIPETNIIESNFTNNSVMSLSEISDAIFGRFQSWNETNLYMNFNLDGGFISAVPVANNTWEKINVPSMSYGSHYFQISTKYNTTGKYYFYIQPIKTQILVTDFINGSEFQLNELPIQFNAKFVSWNISEAGINVFLNGSNESSASLNNNTWYAFDISSIMTANTTGQYNLTVFTNYDSLTYSFTVIENLIPVSNSSYIAIAILLVCAVFIFAYLGANTENEILKLLFCTTATVATAGLSHSATIIATATALSPKLINIIGWFTWTFLLISLFVFVYFVYLLIVFMLSLIADMRAGNSIFTNRKKGDDDDPFK